jgi:hypothetical protein
MSQKKNFIKTTDKETADKLISLGFQLVSQDGNIYTFLNQHMQNFNFEEADKKKIVYTNTLNF